MQRIAVVTAHFPSSRDPWKGRSTYHTLQVVSRRADLRVFYPCSNYPSLFRPRRQSIAKVDASYSPPGVNVTYCNYPAIPLVSRPLNGWMAARVLMPHVRAFAPDLILSFSLYPDGFAALTIGKSLSVPVIVKGVGSDIHSISDPISAIHTRTVLREADFVSTVSEDLRRQAIAMGASPERSRAIVNGCDVSVFHVGDRLEARKQLNIDPASGVVLYLGRLDMRKGLRELVDAATSLHPHRPDLHVYLVGAGPDKPVIETAIQANNSTSFIHISPACSFDKVAVWMTAADLVTLPSYNEGCPNVVLEALACGRPVVATSVGGVPEIMSEACGRLVPPRDSGTLAQALAAVLDTNWDASAISAQGGRSWETVASELLRICESVVPDRQNALHTSEHANSGVDSSA